MAISNIKSIQKRFCFSRKGFSVTLYNSLLIHLLGCNTYHTYQVNTHLPEQSGVVHESIHRSTFSNDQSSNTSQDKLPIMLCWLSNDYGSTLPGLDHGDQLLSADNYMDIILEHKKKGEPRKIFLFINGPGLRGDQVYELKKWDC